MEELLGFLTGTGAEFLEQGFHAGQDEQGLGAVEEGLAEIEDRAGDVVGLINGDDDAALPRDGGDEFVQALAGGCGDFRGGAAEAGEDLEHGDAVGLPGLVCLQAEHGPGGLAGGQDVQGGGLAGAAAALNEDEAVLAVVMHEAQGGQGDFLGTG